MRNLEAGMLHKSSDFLNALRFTFPTGTKDNPAPLSLFELLKNFSVYRAILIDSFMLALEKQNQKKDELDAAVRMKETTLGLISSIGNASLIGSLEKLGLYDEPMGHFIDKEYVFKSESQHCVLEFDEEGTEVLSFPKDL